MFWGLSKGSFISVLMRPLRCGIEIVNWLDKL
jgi:hypothetical protein